MLVEAQSLCILRVSYLGDTRVENLELGLIINLCIMHILSLSVYCLLFSLNLHFISTVVCWWYVFATLIASTRTQDCGSLLYLWSPPWPLFPFVMVTEKTFSCFHPLVQSLSPHFYALKSFILAFYLSFISWLWRMRIHCNPPFPLETKYMKTLIMDAYGMPIN